MSRIRRTIPLHLKIAKKRPFFVWKLTLGASFWKPLTSPRILTSNISFFFLGYQTPVVAALGVLISVCVIGMSYMAWRKKQGTVRQYQPIHIDASN